MPRRQLDLTEELVEGSVAICVGKRLTNLRPGEVIGSCGKVNGLIGRLLGQAFPAIDLAHGNLS
jgi:hypothetical protein